MLEELFQVVYHCKIDYQSALAMPVGVRKWWVLRTQKEEKTGAPAPMPKGPPARR